MKTSQVNEQKLLRILYTWRYLNTFLKYPVTLFSAGEKFIDHTFLNE